MFALKKLLSALILPPASLLFLSLLGLFLLNRRPRLGKALLFGSTLLLLILSVPWVANELEASLEVYPVIQPAQLAEAEAIVVLGGGAYRNMPEYGGDVVSSYSLERVHYAAHLYQQRPLPVLVTGGAPASWVSEGALMKSVLQDEFGIPVRWVEDRSLDTTDNAEFSAAILKSAGVQKIALISHSFHLRRAVPLFEAQGLTVIPAPTLLTGDADHWLAFIPGGGLKTSQLALHEWLGILANKLKALVS